MAATIYAPPEEVGDPPEIDFSDRCDDETIDDMLAPEREWEAKLKEWCRENGKGALRGEEYRFGVADGYARYVVYTERPLALIQIATGDSYVIPEVVRKGLDLAEVRACVERSRKLAEIFGHSNRR